MEIKILVQLNERAELKKFVETCEEHGMELTREGGGKLPSFSGYYAELKGVRWQKADTGKRQLTIPDVVGQSEQLVCDCPIPNTTMELPHRCVKCNKPVKWD